MDDPESIAIKDLAVVSGISLDKAARYEGWDRNRDSSNLASQVVDRLAALEGKVRLEVTIEHTKAATLPPIDVSPSKTAG